MYFHGPQVIFLCTRHAHTQQDGICLLLHGKKNSLVWPFPGRALFVGIMQTPLTTKTCKHAFQDTTCQLWEGPLSFPSFTGDFSAPCTCGFLQDMRPKSRWIQLPGNSPGTLRSLWLLCRCFMAGKCGINTAHTTSRPGYRPWVNKMAMTANPRSFPSAGKSQPELEQQIQREKP